MEPPPISNLSMGLHQTVWTGTWGQAKCDADVSTHMLRDSSS